MATDLVNPRAPTRDELARFLPDHRSIKAFEELFKLVPSEFNSISDLLEAVNVAAGGADTKAQQALDAIGRMTDALELIASAPRRELPIIDVLEPVRVESLLGDQLTPPIQQWQTIDELHLAQLPGHHEHDDLRPIGRDDEAHERIKSIPSLLTQVETPGATGFSVTIVPLYNGKVHNVWLLLKPAAGYAAGTIVLPAVADCIDMQEVTVSCTQQVTALTVNGNGASTSGAPSALSADSTCKLRYNLASTTWHRAE